MHSHFDRRYALTPKQREVYIFVKNQIDETGICPSYIEIMEGVNLKSTGRVAELIKGLKDRGWIDYLPHKARSITIL